MTLTYSRLNAMVDAVRQFPLTDVISIIQDPTARNTEQIAEDVIAVISAAYPEAALATIGLEALIWAIQNPGVNLNTNRDPVGRGGRRA